MCYKVRKILLMLPSNAPAASSDKEGIALAYHTLSEAENLIATRQPSAIKQAIVKASEAVERAQSLQAADHHDALRLLSAAWLTKANGLREVPTAESRGAALEAYEHAVRHFETVMQQDDPDDMNQLANLWTNRGMTLLDDGSTAALTSALPCFERAIELRKELPLERNPQFTWGLSAAWMNAADVLTRLGRPDQVSRALRSYDEAIALLHRMPLDAHPTFRARLAVAWMNRGLAAAAQSAPEATEEALRCFGESIKQLPSTGAPLHPEQIRVLSCAHLNHGHALLNQRSPQPALARDDAFAAQRLVEEFEKREVLAALIGLQSRHLLCRAIAFLVDLGQVPEDWITETTDAVDEGMALARHWRQLGETCLREMETQLFRFGALIYRMCQPHFLAEFVLECMDPELFPGAPAADEGMHHIATDAIWSIIVDINAQFQADPSAANQARLEERLGEVQEAEKRLTELRMQHVAKKPD
jgi:tetratricopeptide (TPR) repeat protein